MKALGTAIGTVVPGVGNLVGFLAGAALDAIAGDEINSAVDGVADVFTDEKVYDFSCPSCGYSWEETDDGIDWDETKEEEVGIFESDYEDEEEDELKDFSAYLDDFLDRYDKITHYSQLKILTKEITSVAHGSQDREFKAKISYLGAMIMSHFVLANWTSIQEGQKNYCLVRAESFINTARKLKQNSVEIQMMYDTVCTLKYPDMDRQLNLGDKPSRYCAEMLGESIMNFDFLLDLYERSRYNVISQITDALEDERAVISMWEIVKGFQSPYFRADAFLNLYWTQIDIDGDASPKLSKKAFQYLIDGYNMIEYKEALEMSNSDWFIIRAEYAYNLANGRLLNKAQDLNTGLLILQETANLDDKMPVAADMANYNLGLIYEEGACVQQDLNLALKYYQKAGDEKKIHEVYSLISAQNDSSKEQSGQKTAQSNAATDVHTQALQKISESEEEFLSELKECFSESGELSASERRLLTRLANRLGISQERAAELEKMAKTPQLTADEEAYIAEYKECLSSGGEISPSERRLLNKLALALNLSSARVKELETYA